MKLLTKRQPTWTVHGALMINWTNHHPGLTSALQDLPSVGQSEEGDKTKMSKANVIILNKPLLVMHLYLENSIQGLTEEKQFLKSSVSYPYSTSPLFYHSFPLQEFTTVRPTKPYHILLSPFPLSSLTLLPLLIISSYILFIFREVQLQPCPPCNLTPLSNKPLSDPDPILPLFLLLHFLSALHSSPLY